MATAAGFKIGDTEYEFPARFRMGDPVLVEELTGLSFADFAERLDAMNAAIEQGDQTADMTVLIGLIGVSVWHTNPRWKRDRVTAFVNGIDMDSFKRVEGDAVPLEPPTAPHPNPSPGSSSESTSTPEPLPAEDLG